MAAPNAAKKKPANVCHVGAGIISSSPLSNQEIEPLRVGSALSASATKAARFMLAGFVRQLFLLCGRRSDRISAAIAFVALRSLGTRRPWLAINELL